MPGTEDDFLKLDRHSTASDADETKKVVVVCIDEIVNRRAPTQMPGFVDIRGMVKNPIDCN